MGNAGEKHRSLFLHVDGDGFFAGCETARNPLLRGKPVVVGEDRGIVLALTYEAKYLGITRGMQIFQVKRNFPDIVCLPMNFILYKEMSERMSEIVRRHSVHVEDYSIDECFAILHGKNEEEIVRQARALQQELCGSLGMTFSFGLANTKVLAKTASSINKPNGFFFIPAHTTSLYRELPIEKVWGIGRRTVPKLRAQQVFTIGDFIEKDEAWVSRLLSRPYRDLWFELSGISILPLREETSPQQSLLRTRSFTPTANRAFVSQELHHNIEVACMKLRQQKLSTREVSIFLKTQEFRYKQSTLRLPYPTNAPEKILSLLEGRIREMLTPGIYRATGIACQKLFPSTNIQLDLFGERDSYTRYEHLHQIVDDINARYEYPAIRLLGGEHGEARRKKERMFGHGILHHGDIS